MKYVVQRDNVLGACIVKRFAVRRDAKRYYDRCRKAQLMIAVYNGGYRKLEVK